MALTALQAAAYLHHLHFLTPDPDRLSGWYATVMDMERERVSSNIWMTTGPARQVIFSPGEAKKLSHAGFALRDVDSLRGLREAAVAAGLSATEAEVPLFHAGSFQVEDPDGNSIVFGLARAQAATPDKSIRGPIQHLTLATQDVQAIEDFYAGKLGFGVS